LKAWLQSDLPRIGHYNVDKEGRKKEEEEGAAFKNKRFNLERTKKKVEVEG
jgi:hypothetical protein